MATTKKINSWSDVDLSNPKIRTLAEKTIGKINDIYYQAMVELARLTKQKKELIAKIEKRADDEKIQNILKNIK